MLLSIRRLYSWGAVRLHGGRIASALTKQNTTLKTEIKIEITTGIAEQFLCLNANCFPYLWTCALHSVYLRRWQRPMFGKK